MKNRKLSKRNTTFDSLSQIPLISVMENSGIPWAIKDNNSRFVYLNHSCLDLFNIQAGFDFEGRMDEEMPCKWSEFGDDFRAQDRKAELSKDGAEIITTSYFGREQILSPWYFPKFPIYNQSGEVLGTLFYGKKFNFISVYDFFNNLKPSVITLTPPDSPFNERELDIIFYVLQRLNAKEISVKLNLSPRTINNRLQQIYRKVKISSIEQLIEYCQLTGLNSYVPKKILKQGVDYFW
ncbi:MULTISPECIES: helix-turn-helix transcriptional regulator [Arsenophonus]|uniref:helix-turn-helix transcriptional regulator n=1 Tax=Arsenophonus TaxID=637 RepID=UPI003879ECCD